MLKKALEDEEWVAMAALQSIGEIGGEESLEILYECLGREEFCDFAITSIEKAGNKDSIMHLSRFIDNTDHVFHRELALEAIIKIAEREKVKLHPESAKKLVPMLLDALGSQDSSIKKPAFIALCWTEDINGISYFLEAITDDELREYAVDGLLSLGRKAAPAIVEALNKSDHSHRDVLARVLSMLGEERALIQFKKDENPEVRREVALALGLINSATSVSALLKMLSDPYEEVRSAAKNSLENLSKKKL